jgi:hypothetical protein
MKTKKYSWSTKEFEKNNPAGGGVWMFVYLMFVMICAGSDLCDDVQRIRTGCVCVCVCLIACDLGTLKKDGLGPIWAVAPQKHLVR